MAEDQIPLFDQRPGNFEATGGLVNWPVTAMASNYDGAGWHVTILTGRARLSLSIAEAQLLAECLEGAIRSAEFGERGP